MKKVLCIYVNRLSRHYTSLSHGEQKCVYAYATSEMTQIKKKPAVEWIAM